MMTAGDAYSPSFEGQNVSIKAGWVCVPFLVIGFAVGPATGAGDSPTEDTTALAAQLMKLAARARKGASLYQEELATDLHAVAAQRDLAGSAHGEGRVVAAIAPHLNDKDIENYLNAVMVLNAVGAAALPAVPDIMQAADRHPEFFQFKLGRPHPIVRLGNLRSEVAAQGEQNKILAAFLSHRHTHVRKWTLGTIAEMGGRGREFTPQLLAMLDEPNAPSSPDVYGPLYGALAAVAEPEVALPRLIQALDGGPKQSGAMEALDDMGLVGVAALRPALSSEKSRVRWAAAMCLGYMTPHSLSATEELAYLFDDPDPRCRLAAVESMWRINHRAAPLIPVLIGLSTEGAIQPSGLGMFSGFSDDKSAESIAALTDVLSADDFQFRTAAADCLAKMGPEARTALPELRRLLDDSNSGTRLAAVRALWCLTHDFSAVQPALAKSLGEQRACSPALAIIEEIGDEALPLWPQLVAVVKNKGKTNTERRRAAKVLGSWHATSAAALPDLQVTLDEQDGTVLSAVALAVHVIDPTSLAPAEALSHYLDELPSGQDANVSQAFYALKQIGPQGVASVPTLIAALENERWSARAVEALHAIGKESLPPLQQATTSDNPEVQVRARQAIRLIENDK